MGYLLKDIYSPEYFSKLSLVLGNTIPGFEPKKFDRLIFDESWHSRELKDRMRHIACTLNHFLPKDFTKSAPILSATIFQLQKSTLAGASLQGMFLPEFIERFGIDYFAESIALFEVLTTYSSCEFAVRPYIVKYGNRMMSTMKEWSKHDNHHVRRLSSEGSRPRLPWAMALPALKKDPSPTLPILEQLKNDSSEYVRKSVANHLNDITKDNPHIVLALIPTWRGMGKETDAIIKHGCRNLLKQGHPQILKFYGLNNKQLHIEDFRVLTKKVQIGKELEFSFSVTNCGKKSLHTRLEYAMYYLRQNGAFGKKVFKITEKSLAAGEVIRVRKNQSFRPITTRKYYAGQQFVAVIVNGKETEKLPFQLK